MISDNQLELCRDYLNYLCPRKNSQCILDSNRIIEKGDYDLCIIVPCYNVEKYVVDCVESILNQKTKYNYWLILIDDGSTDSTMEKLSPYYEHEKVLIVQQENGGLSAARNTGMEYAVGEYILFVDSDDRLFPGAIESMLDIAKAKNADVIDLKFSSDDSEYAKAIDGENGESIEDFYQVDVISCTGYAAGKLFRSEQWMKFCFPDRVWFEDTIVKWLVMLEQYSIYRSERPLYFYRRNENGLTGYRPDDVRCIDTLWNTEIMISELERLGRGPSETYLTLLAKQLILNYVRTSGLDENAKVAIFKLTADIYLSYIKRVEENNIELSEEFIQRYDVLQKAFIIGDYTSYCKICEQLWVLELIK